MQAFLAILRYDLNQLGRSWLVRIWVAALVLPALYVIILAAVENRQASDLLAAYVSFLLAPVSGLLVAIIAVQAITSESGVVADSILSKSVTRTEYILAKIVARLGTTLGIYFAVMLPLSYLIIRYAASGSSSTSGVAVGVAMVAALLAFLTTLGVTLSTLLGNVLLAAAALLLTILFSGAALQFTGLTWMSTTAVLDQLPSTFRGETPIWDEVRVLIIFLFLTAGAVGSSLWLFRRKDL